MKTLQTSFWVERSAHILLQRRSEVDLHSDLISRRLLDIPESK